MERMSQHVDVANVKRQAGTRLVIMKYRDQGSCKAGVSKAYLFVNKFYWNIAMLIPLYISCGYFHTIMPELINAIMDCGLTKLKIFTL